MEDNEPSEIAARSSWKNYQIDQPKIIALELQFTHEQVEEMKKGLVPQQMGDKWFIYYESEWLYFHRSWTGNGIYRARLIKGEDGYSMHEFFAERNKEKYTNEDDNYDIETFFFLIAKGLLNFDAHKLYTTLNRLSDKQNIMREWSSLRRMLFT